MKLTVLMENTACAPGIFAEHGLSLWMETGGRRVLFDMGASGAFADNAARLGVRLADADWAVVSHGHNDHGGGLERFLRENARAPVYVSRYAFEPHGNARGASISLDAQLQTSPRLVFVDGGARIADGLELTACRGCEPTFFSDSFGLTANGAPDDFRHEQYLVATENGRRIVFSGCSHRGVVNIARWLRPDVLVGGFHFHRLDSASPVLAEAADALLATGAEFWTCHCTGDGPYRALKEKMGARLHELHAGQTAEV